VAAVTLIGEEGRGGDTAVGDVVLAAAAAAVHGAYVHSQRGLITRSLARCITTMQWQKT